MSAPRGEATRIDDALLRAWPLPPADGDADKEARGRVLVVAGSREVPGAAVLAGIAALRAGAGKLAVATPASAWALVAAALPEARVIALPESPGGGPLADEAVDLLRAVAPKTAAILIGPGMMDSEATARFTLALLPLCGRGAVVLDALAMDAVHRLGDAAGNVLLTPHAGEMAHLSGLAKEEVEREPARIAWQQARQWRAIVALKGSRTCIARPDGQAWRHEADCAGLATSGSGDVLAGIIAGLAARGAPLEQAAAWGVALHARAGMRLAGAHGPLGFLARELSGEVPGLMRALA